MARPRGRPGELPRRMSDVEEQLNTQGRRWRLIFAVVIAFGLLISFVERVTQPDGFPLAFTVLLVSCGAAFVRPVVGVYLIVFLTLIGDIVTNAWWPFTKNMSSRESILYLSDSVIINPLELLLAVTLLGYFLQRLEDPNWRFRRGELFTPIVVFSAFVLIGLFFGLFLRGGDTRIGIIEVRPLLYLPLVYILVTNLLRTRRQYRRLLLVAFTAVSIQSIFSLTYYQGLSTEVRENLESLTEHSATIHMGALVVFLLTLGLLHSARSARWLLIVLTPPVVYAFILSERRAGMIAMIVGAFVMLAFVFQRHRRAFFVFTPIFLVVGLGIVAAGWNAEGAVGLPAQAVKSVIAPDEQTAADRSSDVYRDIEAYDVWFTIRQEPVTGVGFGRQFYRPLNLPNISIFEFWEYMPHHAVLWIWLKTGYFGFASMLFLIGRAVQLGTRSAIKVGSSDHAATIIAGLTYVVMFIVFAYVDLAWDIRNMVFLGFALALCADFRHAIDTDALARERLDPSRVAAARERVV